MSDFEPVQHPRGDDGKFARKPAPEAGDVDLWNGLAEVADANPVFVAERERHPLIGAPGSRSVQMPEGWAAGNSTAASRRRFQVRTAAALRMTAELDWDDRTYDLVAGAETRGMAVTLMHTVGGNTAAFTTGTITGVQGGDVTIRCADGVTTSVQLDDIVAIGEDAQAMAEKLEMRAATFIPDGHAVSSFEEIPTDIEMDDEDSAKIQAVYLMSHHGFDDTGLVGGCLFFVTDRQPDDVPDYLRDPRAGSADILNGYFWAPSNTSLVSEHGSFYGRDVMDSSIKIDGYEPGAMSFGDAAAMRDVSASETYRRVLGLGWHEA